MIRLLAVPTLALLVVLSSLVFLSPPPAVVQLAVTRYQAPAKAHPLYDRPTPIRPVIHPPRRKARIHHKLIVKPRIVHHAVIVAKPVTATPTPTPTVTAPVTPTVTLTPTPTPTETISSNLVGAAKAVAFALSQIGCPYVYGGTGPCSSGFDCSGLVYSAWQSAGISIPRTSEEQWSGLRHVSTSELQPGDILVFYSGASHVGLYLGDGMMVHAPHTGTNVEKVALAGYYDSNLIGAVRP